MTISEYFDSIKERLLTDSVVAGFQLIRERTTLTDGYLRTRLTLIDNSQLEFSEYVQYSLAGQINVITYSYHWADANNVLIRRWDNTPHFLDLPNFPHHIHDGASGLVTPGQLTNIFAVLDEIKQRLS